MSKRITTSLLALVIALAVFALSGKQSGQVATAAPATSFNLLSALPAADFIIYVDTQRALTDVLPAILVERPEARARIESDIEKFKKQVGFDPRLLDAIAVGLNFNSPTVTGATFALIARGRFDANTTIDAGLTLASRESKGELTKRTQVYEGRTLYMLVPTARLSANRDSTKEPEYKPSDQAMVFVALDSNTVAFGNLKSVRATIDASLGRGRVDDELVQLATRNPNAVACFSGKVPLDMARKLRFGNKEADDSVASIKQVYGSVSMSGNDAEGLVNIRMAADEDARKLSMALNALKFMAKIGMKKATDENKSIEAMIKSVEAYQVGNEVQITSRVALTDLAPFVPKH